MECAEFKRAAGAEPQRLSAAAHEHMSRCLACERYAQHMLSLDALLQRALQLPVTNPRRAQHRPHTSMRWLAIAASFLLTAVMGVGAWLILPAMTLATELIDHVSAE